MWSGFYSCFNVFKLQSISPERRRGPKLFPFHLLPADTKLCLCPRGCGETASLPPHPPAGHGRPTRGEDRNRPGRRCQAKHRGAGAGPAEKPDSPGNRCSWAVWKAGSNKAAPEGLKDPHGPHLDGDANKNLRTSSLQAPRLCPGAINQDMSRWRAGREEACSGERPPAGWPESNGDAVRGREAPGKGRSRLAARGWGEALAAQASAPPPGRGCKMHGNFGKASWPPAPAGPRGACEDPASGSDHRP